MNQKREFMPYSCPITFEKVDATVSRFSSFLVSLLLLVYLFTFNPYILYFLFADFMLRSFCKKDFSPIFQTATSLKNIMRVPSSPSDGGAKRLAGYFGILFLLILIAGNHLDLNLLSLIVTVMFLSCSLLDSFFNYCVGCQIYHLIQKIYPNFMT